VPESIFVLLSRIFLWVIPGAPLLSAVTIAALGPRWLGEKSHRLCIGALMLSLGLSLGLLIAGPMHATGEKVLRRRGPRRTTAGRRKVSRGRLDLKVRVDLRLTP
jgi:peptidoglycan/LPS O-acetylase OafA/YrhL